MTEKELAKRSKLSDPTVLRLTELGLFDALSVPRPQRGFWRIYGEESLLLARVAAAWVALGASAVDASSLLVALRSMRVRDRESFVARVILVRYARWSTRVDWFLEEDLPRYPNVDPFCVPLGDLIETPNAAEEPAL